LTDNFRLSFRVIDQRMVLTNTLAVAASDTAVAEIKEDRAISLPFRIMTPGAGQGTTGKKQGGSKSRPIFHAQALYIK
jgi:hypothetical protein